MKNQTLINWFLFVLSATTLGVLLGVADWSDERIETVEEAPLFGEPVTLDQNHVILVVHPNDYLVLDRLGLLEPCDAEEIVRLMNSVDAHQWRDLSPIMIPINGHFGTNWANWWGDLGKWKLSQSTSMPTDRVSVCIKKP